jgi:hypothetical protein
LRQKWQKATQNIKKLKMFFINVFAFAGLDSSFLKMAEIFAPYCTVYKSGSGGLVGGGGGVVGKSFFPKIAYADFCCAVYSVPSVQTKSKMHLQINF